MNKKTDKEPFPNWYWKCGLHDARVISISYHRMAPDWKVKPYYYNKIEIEIDSSNALFETDIVMIRLYNYKLNSEQIDDVYDLYWYEDDISTTEDGKTYLSIALQGPNEKLCYIDVDFEYVEVIRST